MATSLGLTDTLALEWVESEPSQEFPADNLLKASKINASRYPSMAQIYADYLMQSS
jgi:hypothetical protein